jgi:hypothetical protein
MITLDFIFALMMTFGFSIVFFAVTVALSLIEVSQYVTYATSRAYLGAHETKSLQEEAAKAKFAEVMALPSFKTFFGTKWIVLSAPELGDFSQEYPDDPNTDSGTFVGARIKLDAKVLHLRLPLLGSTAEDSGVGKATLNSYLLREVSTEECREQFTRRRYDMLKELASGGGANYSQAPGFNAKLITDNGC